MKHDKIRQRRFLGFRDIEKFPQLQKLSEEERFDMRVVAHVLPFRTNNYVIENLIDWKHVPDDPIFRLNFMHRDMLEPGDFKAVAEVLRRNTPPKTLKNLIHNIRMKLNPHPAGQLTLNMPVLYGEPVKGLQHKYRETCLIFPADGQTCFSYCTFCFRWPQFVDLHHYKFATQRARQVQEYIAVHREITDVLITGGDPMVMNAKQLAKYLIPLLRPEFKHIQTVRIGTKVLAHWPYRFLTDKDTNDLLLLFKKIIKSGKHLAIMAHFNHPAELSTKAAKQAVRRVRLTGAQIRTQAPLVRHINDSPSVWAEMWKTQIAMGMIPYYMFVERNTGAKNYFEVPLYRALEIYTKAIRQVSGLARTVRGPSMSTLPGKISIDGVAKIKGRKVFVLSFLQGRNPAWVKRPFFARYDEKAVWLDDLKPAFGEEKFFFQEELEKLMASNTETRDHPFYEDPGRKAITTFDSSSLHNQRPQ